MVSESLGGAMTPLSPPSNRPCLLPVGRYRIVSSQWIAMGTRKPDSYGFSQSFVSVESVSW